MQTLARDTDLHIRRAHAYQLALRDLYDAHNPAEHLIWKSVSLSTSQPLTEQAERIRQHLGITLDKQIRWASNVSALKGWRKAIEDAGVFVFKAAFKQKEISSFCLADEVLPLIDLNNSTTKTRQIFSLLHELAHLIHAQMQQHWFEETDGGYEVKISKGFTERKPSAYSYAVKDPPVDYRVDAAVYMLEPKMRKEMADPAVHAKKEGAVGWCANASVHALSHGGKPWRYLLIPHDAIAENMTPSSLASQLGD